MRDALLLGIGRHLLPVPRFVWQRGIRAAARRSRAGLAFMSADHHAVRDFAVRELPRVAGPLAPEAIAAGLDLPLARVRSILDELEAHLTFLFRNARGEVSWAYPVTVEETPHRATFGSGEHAWSP